MCESAAYIRRGDREDLLLQEVARITPQGEKLILESILGEQVIVHARIEAIDLLKHRILLVEGGSP